MRDLADSMCRFVAEMNSSRISRRLEAQTQAMRLSPKRKLRTAWCRATRSEEQAVSIEKKWAIPNEEVRESIRVEC